MIPTLGFLHVMTFRNEARWLAMFIVSLLGVLALTPRASGAEFDDRHMLASIETKEGFRGQRGPSGEEDRWQMMPATIADRGGHDEAAAMRHLVWIKAQLRRAGVDVIPFNVALVWNAGLTRVLQGRAEVRHYQYAAAVVALYEEALTRVGRLEWESEVTVLVVGLNVDPAAGLCARYFVPVPHAPSGASLTEHYEISALCGHVGVRPIVAGGLGLQTNDTPAVIPYEVAGAVECRTGWPCRDSGRLSPAMHHDRSNLAGVSGRRISISSGYRPVAGPAVCSPLALPPRASAPLTEGTALPEAYHFRAAAAMHRRQRAPLAEAVRATL